MLQNGFEKGWGQMKKRVKYLLVMLMAWILVWGTNEMSAHAATVSSGTYGTNSSVQWSYDQDTKVLTITGEDSGLETTGYGKGWMYGICPDVEKIILQDFKPIGSLRYLFGGLSALESIEMNNVDTSAVTSMYGVFSGCKSLVSVDLSDWNTSNVTDMYGLFYECSGLTSVDLTGLDTSKVTDVTYMFRNCKSLTQVDMSDFDTCSVTSILGMFYGCSGLTSLDLSHFDTSQVTNMYGTFLGCSGLTSLNVSSFDTSKVTTMESMFASCNALTSVDVSGFDTSEVTTMHRMFNACNSLTALNVSNWDTSKATTMSSMFYECNALASVDVSGFNTSNVTTMSGMFYGCAALTSLDVDGFDTSKVRDMGSMFGSCKGLTTLDLSTFNTSQVYEMDNMFRYCENLTSLNVNGFDTSKVNDTTYMFAQCAKLQYLDLSNWVLKGLSSCTYMFKDTDGLEVLHTPKDLPEGKAIYLQAELCDANGNKVNKIDNALCGSALYKCYVEIGAEKTHVPIDGQLQLTVKVSGEQQDLSENNNYQWASSSDAVATVSAKGVVTGISPGKVTISCSRANRNVASYEVTVVDKIYITGQPADADVTLGENAVFSVNVEGEDLIYRWQFKRKAVDTWIYSGMQGSDTSNITVPGTLARDGYQYRCIITDGKGNKATSEAATLTVTLGWDITQQPESQTATLGDNVTFRVETDCDEMKYRWQFRKSFDDNWVNSGMNGAQTSNIIVPATMARNGYQYRCILEDGDGNRVISDVALLSVKLGWAITGQPANQTVTVGEDAIFYVAANGDGLKYQWQFRKTSEDQWVNSGMTGAKSDSITLQGTVARNGYQYRCVITDGNGNKLISGAATLTVDWGWAIIGHPVDQIVSAGETVTFQVTTTGEGLSYQWEFKKSDKDMWCYSGMPGAKTNCITVQATAVRDGYLYRCIIKDNDGNRVFSDAATLTVK